MDPLFVAGPVVSGILLFGLCIVLGKRVGDELAAWVIGICEAKPAAGCEMANVIEFVFGRS